MLKSELGAETNEEGTKLMMKNLSGGDILFMHHAMKGFMANGIKTDTFGEPLFSQIALEKLYKLVVAGHVHDPQVKGRTIITGSVFKEIIGETEKFIWKINPEDGLFEKIALPGRPIIKVWGDDIAEKLRTTPQNSIVKTVVTSKSVDIEDLKKKLKKFDASLLIEDYPNTRVKAHIKNGAFDFSIETLLKLYSEERKVDYQRLLNGLFLIKN
jgi:DNA repair exonuclease SbcCD nuclease subunit